VREHDESWEEENHPAALLKQFLQSVSQQAEEFTRRKPLEGLLISFVAGLLIGDLIRRRR